jgi:hypothetical protein
VSRDGEVHGYFFRRSRKARVRIPITVYVSARYPKGLTAEEYKKLSASGRNQGFTIMKRDAAVYVRGKMSHPDHQTVTLDGWHRVLMNTENRSSAMRFLAFLD